MKPIELKASHWYTVLGRGQMAAVDLRQIPGCPERMNTEIEIPLKIGQQVKITDHGVYEIRGIEIAQALVYPPFIKPGVCLRLKPVDIIEQAEALVPGELYNQPQKAALLPHLVAALKAARAEIERLQADLHIAESQLGLP